MGRHDRETRRAPSMRRCRLCRKACSIHPVEEYVRRSLKFYGFIVHERCAERFSETSVMSSPFGVQASQHDGLQVVLF